MRLLSAFNLMIARCILFGMNGRNAVAATASGYVSSLPQLRHPRVGVTLFPSTYRGSSTGGFQHCLPKRNLSFLPSGVSRRYHYAPSSLQSRSSEQHGPVVHRSQAPTHLDQVEDAINSTNVYYQHQQQNIQYDSLESQKQQLNIHDNILNFPPKDREAIGVVTNLEGRLNGLKNSGDCRRCWLQKRHCICERCIPLEQQKEGGNIGSSESAICNTNDNGKGIPKVNRLFLLTHHKEIGLTVDTAKLILSTFPNTTRLVVSGIGREFQPSMGEMLDAVSAAAAAAQHDANYVSSAKCLILFPSEDAKTYDEIIKEGDVLNGENAGPITMDEQTASSSSKTNIDEGWDVVVIDGTWSQARKMHAKYLRESEGCLYRVQLSDEAVKILGASSSPDSTLDNGEGGGSSTHASNRIVEKGHQLRRHPIKWREISTLEATRLLLDDMHTDGQFEEQSDAMANYQEIGNNAAKRQLGPPRVV